MERRKKKGTWRRLISTESVCVSYKTPFLGPMSPLNQLASLYRWLTRAARHGSHFGRIRARRPFSIWTSSLIRQIGSKAEINVCFDNAGSKGENLIFGCSVSRERVLYLSELALWVGLLFRRAHRAKTGIRFAAKIGRTTKTCCRTKMW